MPRPYQAWFRFDLDRAYPKGQGYYSREEHFRHGGNEYLVVCLAKHDDRAEDYTHRPSSYTDYYFIWRDNDWWPYHVEVADAASRPGWDGYRPNRRLLRDYA